MTTIEKYAELIIQTGINIQPSQTLVLQVPIDQAKLARLLMKKAYEAGAGEVIVRWMDDESERIYYDMAADEVFDQADEWVVNFKNHYSEIGAAFLSIYADDPQIMEGVDPTRLSRKSRANGNRLTSFRNRLHTNKNAWCEVCVPSPAWAKAVFPDLQESEAVEALWQAIFKATRADCEDPNEAWKLHQMNIENKLDALNKAKFKALRYKNNLGTDLTVELPDKHVWHGGANTHAIHGYKFVANMPTEEIFSVPKYDGVNGKVISSYPLNHNGVLIKDFWFEFENGLVVDYGASENLETLRELLDTDAGSRRLGEVALVPHASPVSSQGILFLDPLYDENASCHFALGEAYPFCIEGGGSMTEEELKKNGVNVSMNHVDFMIGTSDLKIFGLTSDGEETPIFLEGNFVI